MRTGKIHWYDKKTGEGFVRSDCGGLFYFCQKSLNDLSDESSVSFEVMEDVTFIQAYNVMPTGRGLK